VAPVSERSGRRRARFVAASLAAHAALAAYLFLDPPTPRERPPLSVLLLKPIPFPAPGAAAAAPTPAPGPRGAGRRAGPTSPRRRAPPTPTPGTADASPPDEALPPAAIGDAAPLALDEGAGTGRGPGPAFSGTGPGHGPGYWRGAADRAVAVLDAERERRLVPPGEGPPWLRFLVLREIQEQIDREPYPRMAELMGWSGVVRVRFVVRRDGSVRDLRVVQSSGHHVLDRAAVEAVRRAAPFRPPPGDEAVTVPIRYYLPT
jgi:periplasmic protein TonB